MLGTILSSVALIGFIYSLIMPSSESGSLTIVLIGPGLLFIYKGVNYSNDLEQGTSYGGFCKSCGEWCDVIYYKSQECCDCADDLPLNDRCPTCY